MRDDIRSHERIPIQTIPSQGKGISLSGDKEGRLYLSRLAEKADTLPLLIHFHGDYRVAQAAIEQQQSPWLLLHCHWGGGSSTYARPIRQSGAEEFMEELRESLQTYFPQKQIIEIYLSAWSAGYGAIREVLREGELNADISGVLLLDGLHCSYVPERKTLAEGGKLDSVAMKPFVQWAQRAQSGAKSLFITHSSVFPGTYASTTETASYLLQETGVQRKPLLSSGPMGMQQTSIAKEGGLLVLSFAGNSAPDHVDHYHALGDFLKTWKED